MLCFQTHYYLCSKISTTPSNIHYTIYNIQISTPLLMWLFAACSDNFSAYLFLSLPLSAFCLSHSLCLSLSLSLSLSFSITSSLSLLSNINSYSVKVCCVMLYCISPLEQKKILSSYYFNEGFNKFIQ